MLLSQDEASRQPRAEYHIGLQTEINTLHPEVNCKPAPKSALYLLMWFAYHRLVPCQGLFDCGRWYKFCPLWYEAWGRGGDLNWGRVRQEESSRRGKRKGVLHFHTYLWSFGVVRVLVCSILTLFCRLQRRKKKKKKFHKISAIALFLPPFLPCCKKSLR